MNHPPPGHLYLAGFMGTGKSVVGQSVATRLMRHFYDLDDVITSRTNRTIISIFAEEGEKAFRRYESEALASIVRSDPAVIALGGGAPTVPAIRELVRGSGIAILLTADWPTIWNRIQGDSSRPLLAGVLTSDEGPGGDPFKRFVTRGEAIMQARSADYDVLADYVIDTSELSIDDVADRVLAITGVTDARKGD